MSKFWENWRSPELDRGLWQECKFVSGVLVNREKVGKRKKASSPTSAKWIRRRYRSGGAQPPSHSLCWFSFYPPSPLRAQSTATKMIATIYLGQPTFPFFPPILFRFCIIRFRNPSSSSYLQGYSKCQCFRNQKSLLQTLLEVVSVSLNTASP